MLPDTFCPVVFRMLSLALRVLPIPFADGKAPFTHSVHAQAVPVHEPAPERELLSVSKGSAFGR